MKLTNKTYQVYFSSENICGVLNRGDKKTMLNLFNKCKNDLSYESIQLCKYSEKYNCWYAIEKHNNYKLEE